MPSLQALFPAILIVIAQAATASVDRDAPSNLTAPLVSRVAGLNAVVANLPLYFQPNVGQNRAPFQFTSRGEGYALGIARQSVQLTLGSTMHRRNDYGNQAVARRLGSRNSVISMTWVQGNRHPQLVAEQRAQAVSNYFVGNDSRNWRTNVPNYKRVRYQGIYPGIDWTLYGNAQRLEYDFIIAAKADASLLKLKVHSARSITVTRDGNLLIRTTNATVRQLKPFIYQSRPDGSRAPIAGAYRIHGDIVSFAIGPYDHSRALIIDPVIVYSTYVGGSCGENAFGIALDATGNTYVVGQTCSTDFPTVAALQTTNKGDNAFVLKFNPAGNALIYSTYLGGSGGEEARGVAVDSLGNVYVTGWTFSHDFPLMNPFQATNLAGGLAPEDGFVTKLNPEGNALVYSTYLGGSSGSDAPLGIAIDSAGSAYVTGVTASTDYPTTAGSFQSALRGRENAFVTKLAPGGNSLAYSTYLGGSAADSAFAITIDSTGEAIVVGYTNSLDFPLVNPYQSSNNVSVGGSTAGTAFVSKVNASGSGLVYSTYLGGSTFDDAQAVAVDAAGNAYVAGQTCSLDFPVVNAFQATNHSRCSTAGPNGFVTKIDVAGAALVYSTYLGGSGGDNALGIALDAAGDAYVVGLTYSTDFPTVNPVQPTNKAAALDAGNGFVSELSPAGDALLFSTYLGGSGSRGNAPAHITIPFGDSAAAIALDSNANIYVAGKSGSSDFPVVGAFQSTNKTTTIYGSVATAFVAKLSSLPAVPSNISSVSGTHQIVLSWSAVPGATSYNVYQGSSPGSMAFSLIDGGVQSTSFTITQLASGTTYYFEISAVGATGEGAKSSVISATTDSGSSGGGGGLRPDTLFALLVLLVFKQFSAYRGRRARL